MSGIDQGGQKAELNPEGRGPKRAQSGAELGQHQVEEYQAIIARGLRSQGLSNRQIGQVMRAAKATIDKLFGRLNREDRERGSDESDADE